MMGENGRRNLKCDTVMGPKVLKMMKVGVIGIGSMGRNHARVYSEIAELVGVADKNEAAAREVAAATRTEAFTDYKDLLKTDIEAGSSRHCHLSTPRCAPPSPG